MIFSLFKNRCCSFLKKVFKPKPHEMDIKSSQNTVNQRPLIGEGANDTITWLHLSDLHFQTKKQSSGDRNIILNALLDDVRTLKESNDLAPDLILVSGDIAYHGLTEEYDLAKDFFDALLEVTGLSKERLFTVPGNHDLDHPLISQAAKNAISLLNTRQMVEGALVDIQDRKLILRKFSGYFDFINGYLGGAMHLGDDQYFYVRTINMGCWNVTVLGLNSAWSSSGGADERGKLALSELQVRQALGKIPDTNVCVALIHHPFDWLREFDWQSCEALLMDNCDFILRGHMHRTGLSFKKTPDAKAMTIAAGACYASYDFHNAYNIVQLNLARREGTIHLRTWSDSGVGFWTEDTLSYRNVKDGQFHFSLDTFLTVEPQDGDPLRTIEIHFSRHTDRAVSQVKVSIPGIDTPLTRDETSRIEEQLVNKSAVVLTGDAGTGKSGIATTLIQSAKVKGNSTLLIDARRLGHIRNETQLREHFDLKGSVHSAVERIGRYKGCRLIIDQLDSIAELPSALILVDLAKECCHLEGVEVLVISRKREALEERLLERLAKEGFSELNSYPLSEFGVRETLEIIGIRKPPDELIELGRNLLNLYLIGKINEKQPDYSFSTLTDEVFLWEEYLKIVFEREEVSHGSERADHIIAEAVRLAQSGLGNENRTFFLDNPPNSQQRRLISWGIIECDERVCHFYHEKLQDFLYAWDATQRHTMPSIVLEEIDAHRTRNVLPWMAKIYARRGSELHKKFLKEALNV